MTDPILDPYWDAIRDERYRTHLRRLPARLERASRRRSARRPALRPSPRLAWALSAVLALGAAGFVPVPLASTAGVLIAGRTDSRPVSEAFGALEALPLPTGYNLSVSADTLGTAFVLFLPDGAPDPAGTWAARVEAAVPTTDLRVRTVDVVADRALWVALLDRAGVTISASGATRAEIQAQVDRQLDALGSGRAEVERTTAPDGRQRVRITIDDLE